MKKPKLNFRRSILIASGLLAGTVIAGAGSGFGTTFPAGLSPGDSNPPPMAINQAGHVGFGAQVDRTRVLAGGDGTVRMEVVMRADAAETGMVVEAPTDLVVAFDRSTSMAGTKLADAKAALRELVAQLGESDRFALVTYSSTAGIDIPLQSVTPAARQRWHGVINRVQAAGYTNISTALDVASQIVETQRLAGRQARVILISDGIATAGDTSDVGLVRRAQRAPRGEYVLTSVGVGDDFNETLMVALADNGTGNYYYIDGKLALGRVFKDEFDSARETIATGLAVRITPHAGITVVDAAGYPIERIGNDVVFRPGTLFAGQERRVWITLNTPTHTAGSYELASASLTFNDSKGRQTLLADDLPEIACVATRGDFLAGLDKKNWEKSVVNEEYGTLQMEVAESVKRGKKEEAQQKIQQYRARNEDYNRAVGSAAVTDNLSAVGDLERQVEDAFSGANQNHKQKKLSKRRSATAWDDRRVGSKR